MSTARIGPPDEFDLYVVYIATFTALEDSVKRLHPTADDRRVGELMGELVMAASEEIKRGRHPSTALHDGYQQGLYGEGKRL